MNNIVIHGRLTRDPELKSYTTNKGEPGQVARFGVAVNRRFGEETDFFDCSAFNRSGETIAKWFHKGDGIVLSGEMQSRKTDDKTYWSVKVDSWDFAEKKGSENGAQSATGGNVPESMEEIDEDVPF